MEKIFSIFQVDQSTMSNDVCRLQFHGRALQLIQLNQQVYLNESRSTSGIVVEIISYGHHLDKVEPVMGCSIVIEVKGKVTDNIDAIFG